jgi:hypothetical protein
MAFDARELSWLSVRRSGLVNPRAPHCSCVATADRRSRNGQLHRPPLEASTILQLLSRVSIQHSGGLFLCPFSRRLVGAIGRSSRIARQHAALRVGTLDTRGRLVYAKKGVWVIGTATKARRQHDEQTRRVEHGSRGKQQEGVRTGGRLPSREERNATLTSSYCARFALAGLRAGWCCVCCPRRGEFAAGIR